MDKLTKITIPKDVTSLCKHCSNLINIKLLSIITNLGEFYLNDVIIPPFALTTQPDELILRDSVYNGVLKSIGIIKSNH